MEKIVIRDRNGKPTEYTIVPHPMVTHEDLRQLHKDDPPPPMTEEEVAHCRSLGLSQADIDFLNLVSSYLRPAAIKLRANMIQKEKTDAQKARRDLEALSRGELTEDMRRQQELQEYTRQMIREARDYERQRIAKKYLSLRSILEAGVPRAFAEMTMEQIMAIGLPTDLEYPQKRVASFIHHLDDCLERGTGLIFTGPCGTLKTTLACSILLSGFGMGIEGRFVLVMEIMDKLVALERENPQEYQAEMNRLCNVPLLVLDDLGAEGRRGDFVRAKIEQIIFRRHAEMKPIIITTNLSKRQLLQSYSSRIMDRLAERCPILVMKGPSGRSGTTA